MYGDVHLTASGAYFSKVKSSFEIIFTLASGLFDCGWLQDVARLLRVGREDVSECLQSMRLRLGSSSFVCLI